MTRISNNIERVMGSTVRALTALQDLASDLDTLKDSDDPFIGDQERLLLDRYHNYARMMTRKTDETWDYLVSLYEAAAWVEEEGKAEQ